MAGAQGQRHWSKSFQLATIVNSKDVRSKDIEDRCTEFDHRRSDEME